MVNQSPVLVNFFLVCVLAERTLGDEVGLLERIVLFPFGLNFVEAVPFFDKEAGVRKQTLID